MKRLGDLWADTPADWADIAVTGLVSDSRQVGPGVLFAALKGGRHDARQFAGQAVGQGAAAILAEDSESRVIDGVPVIGVKGLSRKLGSIAAAFHDHPSRAFSVLAVTGTNGKTSTAQLLARASVALGYPAGVLGTLGNGMVGDIAPATHTTPDPVALQGYLARFRDAGARVVAMEASSHGLSQGRLNGVDITTAIFTNLTRDHLDYHGTMEHYRDAKAHLFRWPGLRTAILNADDPVSAHYASVLDPAVTCWDYSLDPSSAASFVAEAIELSLQGLRVRCRTPLGVCELRSSLLGRFNVSNLLAVLAGLLSLGIPLDDAVTALSRVEPVPGRMECVSGGGKLAVVDYAHTPDALEKVLLALREHTTGRLWCVFGCGGDRDPGKRPQMGAIARRLADEVVVTSDNPRSEAPERIIGDILAGIGDAGTVRVIPDRAQAVREALAGAGAGDVVLVAGKGHEDYQEIRGIKHPFSDLALVRSLLAAPVGG